MGRYTKITFLGLVTIAASFEAAAQSPVLRLVETSAGRIAASRNLAGSDSVLRRFQNPNRIYEQQAVLRLRQSMVLNPDVFSLSRGDQRVIREARVFADFAGLTPEGHRFVLKTAQGTQVNWQGPWPSACSSAMVGQRTRLQEDPTEIDDLVQARSDPELALPPELESLWDRYFEGNQEAIETNELIERFRREGTTILDHVDEYEAKVEDLLMYVFESLARQESTDKAERMELYRAFAAEAQRRVETKSVNHQWWFLFHFRCSILLTPDMLREAYPGNRFFQELYDSESDEWSSHEKLVAFIEAYDPTDDTQNDQNVFRAFTMEDFPNFIFMPTIIGMPGPAAFNTAYMKYAIVSLLSGENERSDYFFMHDVEHGAPYFDYTDEERARLTQAQRAFLQVRTRYFGIHRLEVEATYFDLTHEFELLLSGLGLTSRSPDPLVLEFTWISGDEGVNYRPPFIDFPQSGFGPTVKQYQQWNSHVFWDLAREMRLGTTP